MWSLGSATRAAIERRAIAVLLVIGGGLGGSATLAAQPTRRAPFRLDSATIMAQQRTFGQYIAHLRFPMKAAGDTRRLMFKDTAVMPHRVRLGPLATIWPEAGAHQLAAGWDSLGSVVARIEVSDSYPPLRLKRGVNYVCVRDISGDSAQGFVVQLRGDRVIGFGRLARMRVYNLGSPVPRFALFTFSPTDDGFCTACDSKLCCGES